MNSCPGTGARSPPSRDIAADAKKLQRPVRVRESAHRRRPPAVHRRGPEARILSAAKGAADQAGVSADTLHVPNAQPAEAIIDAAKSRDCSLIVMASHGRRGLNRLLLGSTTSEVLAHSAVPVLVVR
ncbi:MAG: universal stress protein [Phenylobacterium sp.]|uniref:universal stress protein n=1 Tax=Phenylobacterium sp. TaxID=1871053 RepID=UPI0027168542|nr:universal stress protein [Phenylobacterium sp.]MDO8410942.1 universal stress protein [Phenylobacterium sp.]